MGGGNYDRQAHEAIRTARQDLPTEVIFKSRSLQPEMDPKGVRVRESRDSAAHPDSNAIMFFVDETGSMDHIPTYLATDKKGLTTFMGILTEGEIIPHPQVFFGAIGDAISHGGSEESPLQVGQFESEAGLMDKWLTAIHLERKGGGNGGESYDLAFYFAARHTAMDCWEKRGRKGYLFVTGDDHLFPTVSARAVKTRIGTDLRKDIPSEEIVAEASKTFHAFFLIPDRDRAMHCERQWRDVMGDHVIVMESHEDTSYVAAMLIGLTEGTVADLDAVGAKLKELGCKGPQANRVIRAVEPYAASLGRGGEVRPTEEQTSRRRRRT
jgi:hypothetical protein